MIFDLHSGEDIEQWLAAISSSAKRAARALTELSADPLEALSQMKFKPLGSHPMEDRELNLIEQVNQTFTYLVALRAAAMLFELHPDAGGFRLAPGAHAPPGSLDIESLRPGLVGAETFAAVRPTNNQKLQKDRKKLASRPELHRYIFFMAPADYPTTGRQVSLERDDVQVWSIAL